MRQPNLSRSRAIKEIKYAFSKSGEIISDSEAMRYLECIHRTIEHDILNGTSDMKPTGFLATLNR